jgi:hypothetical protein
MQAIIGPTLLSSKAAQPSEKADTGYLQIPQHAGPGFQVMSGQDSTASRATVPR